jgi:hypothetical protein
MTMKQAIRSCLVSSIQIWISLDRGQIYALIHVKSNPGSSQFFHLGCAGLKTICLSPYFDPLCFYKKWVLALAHKNWFLKKLGEVFEDQFLKAKNQFLKTKLTCALSFNLLNNYHVFYLFSCMFCTHARYERVPCDSRISSNSVTWVLLDKLVTLKQAANRADAN